MIAGVVPIDLLVQERRGSWKEGDTAREVRELILNVFAWINRGHEKIGYYFTQLLNGNGYFHDYLYKVGKVTVADAYARTQISMTPITFECVRWRQKREELEAGSHMTLEHIANKILEVPET